MVKYLPIELIYLIFEYSGLVKNRNGKYMNQLNINIIKSNLIVENYKKKLIIYQRISDYDYKLIGVNKNENKLNMEFLIESPNNGEIYTIVFIYDKFDCLLSRKN